MKSHIRALRLELLNYGEPFQSKTWQGKENPPLFIELLNVTLRADMADSIDEAQYQTGANLPWADQHFDERVSGIPYNPPPSHTNWNTKTEQYLSGDKFSHTYPERIWSKSLMPNGIRFETADLNDLVKVLRKDPTTRQAYLPIYFPEDLTASLNGERVPCTLGWHFILRNGKLHCHYPIRSCDAVRHFHNDVYFANRLTLWLIEKAGLNAKPGELFMNITSFHCFENDRYPLKKLTEI